MRVITLNCNGIRAAERKGLFDWLPTVNADVIKLQEVRADLPILEKICQLNGYYAVLNPAERKGYSGTAILSKEKPSRQCTELGIEIIDEEGRWCEATIGNINFVSLYLPSGSAGDLAQQRKDGVLAKINTHFQKILAHAQTHEKNILISGDWNIAHTEKDLKNWRGNLKNSGFLPHERKWLSDLLFDWVDVYRHLYPHAEGEGYTWWSNRGQSWKNNTGWRIDYQIATPELAKQSTQAHVYKEQRFSDHSPLIIDYKS